MLRDIDSFLDNDCFFLTDCFFDNDSFFSHVRCHGEDERDHEFDRLCHGVFGQMCQRCRGAIDRLQFEVHQRLFENRNSRVELKKKNEEKNENTQP
mgnify:FL=1